MFSLQTKEIFLKDESVKYPYIISIGQPISVTGGHRSKYPFFSSTECYMGNLHLHLSPAFNNILIKNYKPDKETLCPWYSNVNIDRHRRVDDTRCPFSFHCELNIHIQGKSHLYYELTLYTGHLLEHSMIFLLPQTR